jgi:deoxyribodipyrimidine photo-lyase
MGAVLPLYIVEPEYWALPDTSARQWTFIAESLSDLRDSLGALGAPLVVRQGDAVTVLAQLCRAHRISTILSHEETGNLWTFARDRRVAAWAGMAGVDWHEVPQSGVVRRLRGRDGWARQRDAFMASKQAETPAALRPVPGVEPGPIPTARALRLADDPCPHRQTGGRAQGALLLDSFLTTRGEPYRAAMSSPVTGERACSRLSPHIALGTLSLREVVQATAARQAQRPGGRWPGALASFQSRLAWRDHFMQKLEDQPGIEVRCLHRAAEGLRPREPDATRLAAWDKGETGLPFMDACLRYLAATGWLNFRMRSMVMSFASYHLWLDWRATGAILGRRFTDYEPGIHWPQVQMQSGTTGINTPRIYNPVKQGLDQDPTGAFTRAWVPELAAVPDRFLQTPWAWDGAGALLGRRYPAPIVDVTAAHRTARDAIFGLRKGADRGEIAAIINRHASRADPRFVNDRAPRRRAPSAQLSLDL